MSASATTTAKPRTRRAALRRTRHLLWLSALLACATQTSRAAPTPSARRAPVAEKRPHVVRSPAGDRSDEYYWLRDDSRSAPEVLAHLAAENAYADAQLAPQRAAQRALYEEIVARMPQDDVSVPVHRHGYFYATRFVRGGDYPVHVRRRGQGGDEQVLLDGNALARGHGYFRIASHEPSPDGRRLAWSEDVAGRGQHTIRFKDLDTGAILPDEIHNAEPSLAWADAQTLLYIEKDRETLLGFRVRKHLLGGDPAQDPLVYEEQDHSFYLELWRGRSQRYLYLYAQSTSSSEQWLARADDPELTFRVLVPREPEHEYLAEDFGDRFILRTNFGAPNFRIVEVSARELAQRARWRELVAQPGAGLLEEFAVFRDFLAYAARADGLLRVHYRRWSDGRAGRIELAEPTSSAWLGENPEPDSQNIRVEVSALGVPLRTYEYHVPSGAQTLLKREPVLGDFRESDYRSAYLKAPARDGTPIPVSLVARAELERDGSAALYLTGYGAYGDSEDPEFESARLSLLERGVVFAIAHVRGGQELGRAWYDQGRLRHKRNTFSDFIDVTDFLVRARYAAKDRVVARGASAGGLLMGAVANLAPDRYRAIVAHVPFVDVVTTMLDPSIPLTSNEFEEWGDPRRKADYDVMLSYSPYDNVRAQAYPAMFVTSGLWDSQVQYYEPVKWVARLRAKKTDPHPLVLRVNMEAGHAGRSGRFVRQAQLAEEYAFLLDQLGIPVRGPRRGGTRGHLR